VKRIAKTQTVQDYAVAVGHELGLICTKISEIIAQQLPEAEGKIWHGSPIWFIKENPVVGYSAQKAGIKLMFFSGADFDEPVLKPGSGKFKDASITITQVEQIDVADLSRWLAKARMIQWDYKNIVKNRGLLKLKQD